MLLVEFPMLKDISPFAKATLGMSLGMSHGMGQQPGSNAWETG